MSLDALQLPVEYEESILTAAYEVDRLIDWDLIAARDASQRELALLQLAAKGSGRRLHLGHPFHNLGVSYFAVAPDIARTYFVAAFIEDWRTYSLQEGAVGRSLAGRMLRSLYGADLDLEWRVGEAAQGSAPSLALAESMDAPPPLFPQRLSDFRSQEELEAIDPTRRVFVGGSYSGALDRIDTMVRAVRTAGLEAVVVAEYQTLGERPRVKSFRLLDLCSSAVFEGTVQVRPGWWPELERIVQIRQIPTLVAYHADTQERPIDSSSMFPTTDDHPGLTLQGFGSTPHLGQVVQWWIRTKLGMPVSVEAMVELALGPGVYETMEHSLGSLSAYILTASGVPYDSRYGETTSEPTGGSVSPYLPSSGGD